MFGLSLFLVLGWFGGPSTFPVTASVEESSVDAPHEGGIATLYALDPLASSLCLHDGREGLMIRNFRVSKRCNDLVFNPDGNRFVTGTDTSRVGAIVDVGTAEDLRAKYGQGEAAAAEIGFASIRLVGDQVAVFVQKEDKPQEKVELLKEAQTLFSSASALASTPIVPGHIYILRNADIKETRYQLMVKLLVIAFTPNETVTVRWQRL
jgi:hypothetical protein